MTELNRFVKQNNISLEEFKKYVNKAEKKEKEINRKNFENYVGKFFDGRDRFIKVISFTHDDFLWCLEVSEEGICNTYESETSLMDAKEILLNDFVKNSMQWIEKCLRK